MHFNTTTTSLANVHVNLKDLQIEYSRVGKGDTDGIIIPPIINPLGGELSILCWRNYLTVFFHALYRKKFVFNFVIFCIIYS